MCVVYTIHTEIYTIYTIHTTSLPVQMEFKKWTRDEFKDCLQLHILDANTHTKTKGSSSSTSTGSSTGSSTSDKIKKHRLDVLQRWYAHGGICIMGYDLLRSLVAEGSPSICTVNIGTGYMGSGINTHNTNNNNTNNTNNNPSISKKHAENIAHSKLCYKYLINPGADIVVADEAHQIKNPKAKITRAVNEMKTKLKIALTGSPLQNNLLEYWCMVHWVKKSHLGSQKSLQGF